jgi:hypothetical protein
MALFDDWSMQNMMRWTGDKADQLGRFGFGDQMRLQDNPTFATYLKGANTPWAASGQKSMTGVLAPSAPLEWNLGATSNYGSTPWGQLQNQDLQAWMDLASGNSVKDKAPEEPTIKQFDPNAYASADYTPLQKSMQHNAQRSAYESKRQAKAGGYVNSADFAANQAAIQRGLGEQNADIANQIAGLQTQDKLNAYQQEIGEQARQYQQDLANWKNQLATEQGNISGAIGRLGAVGGALAGIYSPWAGMGVNLVASGAQQKLNDQYAGAAKSAADRWNDYLKNYQSSIYQSRNYKPQQTNPDYYGGW